MPYWRKCFCDVKGVYCSLYRGKETLTAVVSNLTNGDKTVTLDFACGNGTASNLIGDGAYEVRDGRMSLMVKPFTPYILAIDPVEARFLK